MEALSFEESRKQTSTERVVKKTGHFLGPFYPLKMQRSNLTETA
jgi:hypothetical protein